MEAFPSNDAESNPCGSGIARCEELGGPPSTLPGAENERVAWVGDFPHRQLESTVRYWHWIGGLPAKDYGRTTTEAA